MSTMASQITGVSIVYSTVCSGADQRKHQISASLAFVRVIHRWPVNSPHKWPVTRKMFSFDDVIMREQPTSENTNIGQAWAFEIVIFFVAHCIMSPTFRLRNVFQRGAITSSLRPGPNISWKNSKFHGTHKNWPNIAILKGTCFALSPKIFANIWNP